MKRAILLSLNIILSIIFLKGEESRAQNLTLIMSEGTNASGVPAINPEDPSDPTLNPCSTMDIKSVNLAQNHDGWWFAFYGSRAQKFNTATQEAYIDNIWACVKNPNTDALVTAAANGTLHLLSNFGWLGRYPTDYTRMITRAIDILGSLSTSTSRGASTACFICGNIRSRGCFPPGVRIMSGAGEYLAIEEYSVGDFLWNPVLKKQAKILRIVQGEESKPIVEFGFGDTLLKTSQEHPVLTVSGIKQAQDLVLEDSVLDSEGKPHKLTTIKNYPVQEGQTVINFILETESSAPEERMILAEGIITGDLVSQIGLAIEKDKK